MLSVSRAVGEVLLPIEATLLRGKAKLYFKSLVYPKADFESGSDLKLNFRKTKFMLACLCYGI